MSLLLGLLPDLLTWLPHILGGLGGGLGLLGLVPNLRTYALIGLAVVVALSVVGLLWFRGEYEACKAGRIADAAEAAQAASKKLAEAKKDSDTREARLQEELGAHRATADIYRDMVANAQPSSCPPSAGARAASRGLGVLLADPHPAGGPAAK